MHDHCTYIKHKEAPNKKKYVTGFQKVWKTMHDHRAEHTQKHRKVLYFKRSREVSPDFCFSLCASHCPVGCSCCCLFGPGGYAKTLKKQGEEPFLNPINNIVSNSTVWSTLINRCQTPCSPPLFFNQGRRHFCQISFKFARLVFLGVNSKTQDKRGTPTKNKKKFRTNNNNVGGKNRKRILPA